MNEELTQNAQNIQNTQNQNAQNWYTVRDREAEGLTMPEGEDNNFAYEYNNEESIKQYIPDYKNYKWYQQPSTGSFYSLGERLENAINTNNSESVENIIENNPQDAMQTLQEVVDVDNGISQSDVAPLAEEINQLSDNDSNNDEISNEVVEDTIKEINSDTDFENWLEEQEKAGVQKKIGAFMPEIGNDDAAVEDFIEQIGQENESKEAKITDFVEENMNDKEKGLFNAAKNLGMDTDITEHSGYWSNWVPADKSMRRVDKVLSKAPKYGESPSDYTEQDLKRAAKQKNTVTKQEFGFTRKEARAELDYRQGKGNILDTKPTPYWDEERFAAYNKALQTRLGAIKPESLDAEEQIKYYNKKLTELNRAHKQRQYLNAKNDRDLDSYNQKVEEVKEEIKEDPNTTEEDLLWLEQTTNNLFGLNNKKEKIDEDYELNEEEQEWYDSYIDRDNRQVALWNGEVGPARNLYPDDELKFAGESWLTDDEIDDIVEESSPNVDKETKERRKKILRKLSDIGVSVPSIGSFLNKKQSISPENKSTKPTSKSSSNDVSVSSGGSGSIRIGDTIVKNIKPIKAGLGKKAGQYQSQNPIAATDKVNDFASKPSNIQKERNEVGGGGIKQSQSKKDIKAGKTSLPSGESSKSSGSSGKLSIKDDLNVSSIKEKIIHMSKSWEVDEDGTRTSKNKYLPFKFFVKDDFVGVSQVGSGIKKQSLESFIKKNPNAVRILQKIFF